MVVISPAYQAKDSETLLTCNSPPIGFFQSNEELKKLYNRIFTLVELVDLWGVLIP